MYEVIKMFTDLKDNNYRYEVGDSYPREGYKPTEERIRELSSYANKQHTALIKAVYEPATEETKNSVSETAEKNVVKEKPKARRTRKKKD